jgi:hypothetical protein
MPPLREVGIEPLTAGAFVPLGGAAAALATTYLMISDQETQAVLVASYAGHGRWALTQEIDLERDCGAAVERVP